MSEDEQPGEEHGQDELIAAFAALSGRLTAEELMRLLKAGEYSGALVRLATLLLDGDTAAPEPSCGTRSPPCSTHGPARLTPARRVCTCARQS